jgi:hypothetical protein
MKGWKEGGPLIDSQWLDRFDASFSREYERLVERRALFRAPPNRQVSSIELTLARNKERADYRREGHCGEVLAYGCDGSRRQARGWVARCGLDLRRGEDSRGDTVGEFAVVARADPHPLTEIEGVDGKCFTRPRTLLKRSWSRGLPHQPGVCAGSIASRAACSQRRGLRFRTVSSNAPATSSSSFSGSHLTMTPLRN